MKNEIGLAFPNIDPVAFSLGPLSVKWYGLAYLVSLLLAIFYIKKLSKTTSLWQKNPNIKSETVDDLGFYAFLGVFFGGRLGYVLFYNLSYFIENPLKIFMVWDGGMSIHGGILFSALILLVFSRVKKSITDIYSI